MECAGVTQGRIPFIFSAIKDYVVFAPTTVVVRAFVDRLNTIETTSSTVAIGQPLSIDLVWDMAVYRLHDVLENDAVGYRRKWQWLNSSRSSLAPFRRLKRPLTRRRQKRNPCGPTG